MSTYIMTDIHGHYDAMRKMFEKIGFSHHDRLICAGDYIDRGPKSYEMPKDKAGYRQCGKYKVRI